MQPTPSLTTFDYQVRVQDTSTGEVIQGAEVIIEVGGLASHDGFTDNTGTARIFISADRVSQPGRVIVRANGYQSFERNIDLTPDALPDVVRLEPVPEPTATDTPVPPTAIPTNAPPTDTLVSPIPTNPPPATPLPTLPTEPATQAAQTSAPGSYALQLFGRTVEPTASNVCIAAGDTVTVTASGEIKTGNYVGYLGPDGAETFMLFGASVPIDEGYDIVQAFPHAAMMCRIGADDDWRLCGSNATFTADKNGCLEFQTNDIDKGNNDGFFDIRIEIAR
ncbi:MAG: hypothetical protein HC876_05650 [Chloroflexaceae bacterium]|nr:hypothetical protein [Chloroflexaceae bacterium]